MDLRQWIVFTLSGVRRGVLFRTADIPPPPLGEREGRAHFVKRVPLGVGVDGVQRRTPGHVESHHDGWAHGGRQMRFYTYTGVVQ